MDWMFRELAGSAERLGAFLTPDLARIGEPDIVHPIVAAPMTLWVRLVTPLVWAIRGASDGLTTRIVGEEKAAENILHVDEFRTLVETSAEEGEINATERTLIHNLPEAGDTEIVEIMTPRTVESGHRFTVEEASDRTILKLRVAPVGAGSAAPAGG